MPSWVVRAGQWLARLLLVLSALCLTALMLLTVAEVIGRYMFNAPIFGRQDMAQILLACSIFLAFPVVTLRGEQIAVDLFDGVFTKATAFWRDRLIEVLTSVALLSVAFWLFERAEKAASRGLTSELLFLPKYPLIAMISAVVFVTSILLAVRAVWLVSRREDSKTL